MPRKQKVSVPYVELRHVLALDTITLDILNHKGERREAALIAPTHPLRALWLTTWAEVAEAWLHQAATGVPEHIMPTRDALLKTLAPLSFPPVLPRGTGQLFTAVDNLTPFWTLYAPASEEDLRGLVGDVCVALGLPEPGIGGATITGSLPGEPGRALPHPTSLRANAGDQRLQRRQGDCVGRHAA